MNAAAPIAYPSLSIAPAGAAPYTQPSRVSSTRSRAEVEARLVTEFDAGDIPLTPFGPLHAATVIFARCLRGSGLPPEKVVIALKSLLRRHGGFAAPPSGQDGAGNLSPG